MRVGRTNSIVGSWQLIGSKYGTGAEVIEKDIDSEYILTFYNNGKYRESVNGKQIDDQYLIDKGDLIVLINSKTSESNFYSYNFKGNKLILDKVDKDGSLICDEGCSTILKRIKE
ncbi:hypothetical protein OMO38_11850 [Chryseobacterium sp. 09-1422]|uniref:Lipocalin-like domain-containing protein n=1 Tax=Chryseobacterium kimseyorum TaxID=2984028 RepID=A0ABT3HZI5_9FLAO|nr:hypothetical protein [Chryseobacterium kimseyorum]MCW3169211.1 hypothetical protein [Chryseobacterium kimseyorum]